MNTDGLDILLRTERLVAVNKPEGLLSTPGKGPDKQDSVATRVRAMFVGASGPLLVHRLDMETSGVMVLALDAEAHRDLSMQFERREVEKRYEAILRSAPPGDSGEVVLRQRLDVENRPLQIIDDALGKESRTRWRLIDAPTHRVEFEPLTGRTHQLRVASKHGLGVPIAGDTLYGGGRAEAERLMLHATFLALREPGTGTSLEIESRAPF